MSYILEWADDNAFVTFSGETNVDEIIEVSNRIIGDARFDNLQFSIFNYLNIDNYNLNEEEVNILAALNKNASQWNQHVRLALVVNNDYVEKLLLQYIQLMSKIHWKIELFNNLPDAVHWCKKTSK